jgi:hypothetical protein
VFFLNRKKTFAYKDVSSSCKSVFSNLFTNFVPLQSDSVDLSIQLCIEDESSQRILIKFAHVVEVWEARKTEDGGILRSKVRRRHILVAEINASIQVVSIGFPGFAQPVESSDKVSYNLFAMQVAEVLSAKLAIDLVAFPLKPTTDYLLQDGLEGVVDLRRTLRFERGGKMDLDSESDKDAASALAQGLASTGVVISADAIRTAFRASEAQSIVLLWQKQRLLTRLSMRNSLPEVLFIWDEAERSLSLVDEILGKFARARRFIGSHGLADARKSIAAKPAEEIIRPSWLEQHFAISQDEALRLLLEACSLKLCVPVFRVRPDRVLQKLSGWVSSISEIPSTVHDEDGALVDSRSPANIEVGFKRVVQ